MNEATPKEQSTTDKKTGSYSFSAFPLYEHKTPVFKENQRSKIVDFGDNNDYPDYLAYLYNRSALHSAILKGKATYIFGKGWEIKAEKLSTEQYAQAQELFNSINGLENLDELTQQIISDWLVFGGYGLKITKLAGKIISIKLQPFSTIRTDEKVGKFYISYEWTPEMSVDPRHRLQRGKLPKDVEIIDKFDPTKADGKFIFYHRDSRPAMKVYPLPEYEAAIAAIETEIEIRNYDLNRIKSGFAAGTMITLFNGEPPEDQKEEIERDLKGKLAGTDNAGEIVLNYQMVDVPEPKVLNLSAENIADQYELLDPRMQQAIISGHGITSGMLFGIKEQGQLGGRNELKTAWELFYNTYVRPKQIELEKTINYFVNKNGLPSCFNLTQLEPLGLEIDMNHVQAALDPEEFKEYIRDKLGIKPKKTTMSKHLFEMAENHIKYKLTSQLGEPAENFTIVKEGGGYDFAVTSGMDEVNQKVYDYLKDNPKSTLARIAESVKISEPKVMQIIENLQKGNYIQADFVERNGKISVESKPNIQENDLRLESRWKYDWVNPSDSSTIDRSRDFCQQMLRANRLYTRAEIDSLTNEMEGFNTDVWRYRGGWYNDSKAGVNLPYCRHFWKQLLVKR